jgi:lysophospholipid acyltransferase (LPLAT)-like uncharacterized protein
VIYKALSSTWRIRIYEPPELSQRLKNSEPYILAHWHGDEIALLSLTSRYKIATLVSTSRDGEIMNTVLRLLGASTTRGSSTRGGASGLRSLIRLMRSGHPSSMAVDGPKGPIHEVKAGVFELSRLADCPIFAAGVSCDRAWRFEKSWNKSYLPKPFARLSFVWSNPIGPITTQQDPRSSALALSLKEALRHSQLTSGKAIAPLSGGC